MKSAVQAWWLAARPKTLTAAAVPVMVGMGVAHASYGIDWAPALVALLGAFAIQIGTNFANDYFDFVKGADTEERLGPTRAVQAGLITARQMQLGTFVAFAVAALLGIYLVYEGGFFIAVIGVFSIASGIAYTGGPYPLAYNGLGDVFVFIFFGFVAVSGTVWVQHQTLPASIWMAALPIALLSTAILVVNNLRDEVQDRSAQKRTLVVRYGRQFGLYEFYACLSVAYITSLFAALQNPWALLPWATLPIAGELGYEVASRTGASLNDTLAKTAQLLFAFGVAWALGLSLAP